MGPVPWCVCWCTRVVVGELWWVWGCHDVVKLVLWRKIAGGAMGFGVARGAAEWAGNTTPRTSPRKHQTSPELSKLYKGQGGPRIAAPHHAPAARKVALAIRVAASSGWIRLSRGGGAVTSTPASARPDAL